MCVWGGGGGGGRGAGAGGPPHNSRNFLSGIILFILNHDVKTRYTRWTRHLFRVCVCGGGGGGGGEGGAKINNICNV